MTDVAIPSFIIFGASGDLTRRKLIPALYNLFRKERLPEKFRIIGYARSEFSQEAFEARLREGVETFADLDRDTWQQFASHLQYVQGNYDDPSDLQQLNEFLKKQETERTGRLFYLAVPPSAYRPIIRCLGGADMAKEQAGWCRIVIEKPFGYDLASARDLNASVHAVFDEKQVYRIDHYLGKETVQNILVFRFANTIFEPVWNRNYVDHVQITAAESVDVGHRAGYYDGVGVIRDMFQNHLMQLLALVSMEPPVSFEANALRNEKVKVLAALRPIVQEDMGQVTVRAQYEGYRDTEGVASESTTATFAALKLFIDNWRWQGVPFYVRSGKNLAAKTTEITVHFKCPPHLLFDVDGSAEMTSNYLSLCIQPDEGIHLRFEAKVPDTAAQQRSVDMEFHYRDAFGAAALPDAYERLLLDALQGDASLFTRADEIELAWKLIDAIVTGWQSEHAPPLESYAPGSWGPSGADALLEKIGASWTLGCEN